MLFHRLRIAPLILTTVALACAGKAGDEPDDHAGGNVLLAEWTGPHDGVPAFDRVDLADMAPAIETGMAKHLEEIDAIADNPEPPTFDNTIAASFANTDLL